MWIGVVSASNSPSFISTVAVVVADPQFQESKTGISSFLATSVVKSVERIKNSDRAEDSRQRIDLDKVRNVHQSGSGVSKDVRITASVRCSSVTYHRKLAGKIESDSARSESNAVIDGLGKALQVQAIWCRQDKRSR
jgi:hypothetical protein